MSHLLIVLSTWFLSTYTFRQNATGTNGPHATVDVSMSETGKLESYGLRRQIDSFFAFFLPTYDLHRTRQHEACLFIVGEGYMVNMQNGLNGRIIPFTKDGRDPPIPPTLHTV